MAPPPPWSQLLLLGTLAGLLSPTEVTAEPAEEAGARCPEGPWPLPQQMSPRVTYTRRSPRQAEDVSFLYHPCAHPWLKLQLALLAHSYVAQPSLVPDSTLTQARPLVLEAWGVVLEMAWVEPAWAAHWLKRRRRKKQRKKGLALAFTPRSWWPPGTEVASRGPRHHYPGGAKRRGLRAALGLQPTPSTLRFPSASSWSWETRQPMLGTPAPPREARGPTPRTEEAAWAAMALTFLLVLLTLATLCTRLHRNFRRGESIYWGPIADSQDTVAAVLKRRLLMPPRRVKRSRRRPLLPPTPDSGGDGDSSD
ncbi:tumor protein p53-inducible protein 13 isoform X5 [Saccopteryx bilineata]|uniref:tumor protein p53-inducible protein 13 isoform X5 n=1 Tax=Saccopteryx bilineata TaxID=59482 RepID=UPI00338F2431